MIEQLAIFSENKPGKLERITGALSEAGINIRALHVASLGDMGVIKMIVDRPDEAFKALGAPAAIRKLPCVAVQVPDRPGALHQACTVLRRADINIEDASGFAVSGSEAILILEVSDVEAAEDALIQAGFKTLNEEDFGAAVG